MHFVEAARLRALELIARIRWLAPLWARLMLGLLFVSTGWGKVNDLEKPTKFFESLHIPAPHFNAILVGYSELICGSLLILGLCTRLATIPLIISMIVATLTAQLGKIHNIFDLVGLDEFAYLTILVVIAIIGPGAVSLDRLLVNKLGWKKEVTSPA